jgi:hypothetical protein
MKEKGEEKYEREAGSKQEKNTENRGSFFPSPVLL